jgi:hypothetical protein
VVDQSIFVGLRTKPAGTPDTEASLSPAASVLQASGRARIASTEAQSTSAFANLEFVPCQRRMRRLRCTASRKEAPVSLPEQPNRHQTGHSQIGRLKLPNIPGMSGAAIATKQVG